MYGALLHCGGQGVFVRLDVEVSATTTYRLLLPGCFLFLLAFLQAVYPKYFRKTEKHSDDAFRGAPRFLPQFT